MVTTVECATMWAPDYMLNYYDNLTKTTDIDVYIDNAILVIRDFIDLVTTYGGINAINRRAPHDKRFKLTRNGSFYELAGYTFHYNYIHNVDGELVMFWECCNFEAHVLVRMCDGLVTITKGEMIVKHKLGEI